MTDAKQEALRLALQFHTKPLTLSDDGTWRTKDAKPESVVRTAAVFEKFLEGKSAKRG